MMYQQGDVLFLRTCKVPAGKEKQGLVIADGEATGHCHAAVGEGCKLVETEDGTIYLSAPSGATITHQEHGHITLPPGVWETRRVKEYDHFLEESRRVAD